MAREEDLVPVSASGEVMAVGPRAAHRLQARSGPFRMLPSPPGFVVLKREGDAAGPARSCVLSGEILSAGVLCDILSFVRHTGWRGEFIVYGSDDGVSRSIFFEDSNVLAAQ